MSQSYTLSQFYAEYLAWVDAGAYDHPVFDCDSGLCLQLDRHIKATGGSYTATDEMEKQFVNAGLCDVLPFNGGYLAGNGNLGRYIEECKDHVCHINEERIAWVRNRVLYNAR